MRITAEVDPVLEVTEITDHCFERRNNSLCNSLLYILLLYNWTILKLNLKFGQNYKDFPNCKDFPEKKHPFFHYHRKTTIFTPVICESFSKTIFISKKNRIIAD